MAGYKRPGRPVAITASGDWEEAPTEFTTRVAFMDIFGETGTGRTQLALTAPGPIALAHAAEKIDGIVQPVRRSGKMVKLVNFGGSFKGNTPTEIAAAAAPVWDRLKRNWYSAESWAKTVIIDTATEGWELIRVAQFGTPNPKGRTDALYGPVNAEWRSLFKHYKNRPNMNIITIHQAKDEYIDKIKNGQQTSFKTGRTIRSGMKEMPYMADVIIETSKENGVFKAVIRKAWMNALVEGTTFESPNAEGVDEIDFATIMAFVTETPAEEWR